MMLTISSKSLDVLKILFISVLCFQACSAPSGKDQSRLESKKTVNVSVETFKLDSLDAWGYEILKDGKIYIYQKFIPALDGERTFKSREDAMKVGKFVLVKIKNKQSPALTKDEVLKLLDIKE